MKLDSLIAQADEKIKQLRGGGSQPMNEGIGGYQPNNEYSYLEEDMGHYLPGMGLDNGVEFHATITGSAPEPEVDYAGGVEVDDVWWDNNKFTPEQNQAISAFISNPRNEEMIKEKLTDEFNRAGENKADNDSYQLDLRDQSRRDDRMTGLAENFKFVLTGKQVRLLRESMEAGSNLYEIDADGVVDENATLKTHDSVAKEIHGIVGSGKFCSFTYVKKDNTLRLASGGNAPTAAKEALMNNRRYNPSDYNLITYWDTNAPSPDGQRGAWRQFSFARLLIFTCGAKVYDLTTVNASAVNSLQGSDQQKVLKGVADLKAKYGESVQTVA